MDNTNPFPRGWDLTRIVLGVMTIGGLVMASFWVVRPFLLAAIWATMIVVSTWPTLLAVQARLWGRRSLAVLVMTAVMLMLIIVPLATAVVGVAERTDKIIAWSRSAADFLMAGPPDWVRGVPLIGRRVAERWEIAAAASSDELTAQAAPYLREVARWVLGQVGTVGALLVQLLLTVIIVVIMYANGETAAAGVRAVARRLGGQPGERAAILSGRAIRAVAMGIVVTALVQSVIGGVGLLLVGVPYPLLLSSLMFLLGIAQIGALPVLLGAVIWAYWSSGVVWGTVMLLWAIFTGSLDNVLRPILIKRGADLPLLLVFAGVLGGLFAFGLIGLFVGPVVLSVTYTLLVEWVGQGEGQTQAQPEEPAALQAERVVSS